MNAKQTLFYTLLAFVLIHATQTTCESSSWTLGKHRTQVINNTDTAIFATWTAKGNIAKVIRGALRIASGSNYKYIAPGDSYIMIHTGDVLEIVSFTCKKGGQTVQIKYPTLYNDYEKMTVTMTRSGELEVEEYSPSATKK